MQQGPFVIPSELDESVGTDLLPGLLGRSRDGQLEVPDSAGVAIAAVACRVVAQAPRSWEKQPRSHWFAAVSSRQAID